MYNEAKSKTRVNGLYSNEFELKIQDSVLSPLLFIIVLQALPKEFRTGYPWELLYVDDLKLLAESLNTLVKKFEISKINLKSKGPGVYMDKTKVML